MSLNDKAQRRTNRQHLIVFVLNLNASHCQLIENEVFQHVPYCMYANSSMSHFDAFETFYCSSNQFFIFSMPVHT